MELTSQNFDTIIKKNSVVLVDFWAQWCGPCRVLDPIINTLSKKYKNNIGKVNVDTERQLASRFQIRGIPTTKIFKNGEVVDTIVGVKSSSFYEDKLKYYLN